MRFPVVFSLAGLLLTIGGAWLGGVGWIAVWVGMAFFWLAGVYGADRPDWLGKRADGSMDVVRRLVFFPYFGFSGAMWHLFHRVTPEPACHEVAPGLWLGRRPVGVPLDGVSLVVDCTSEFPAVYGALHGPPQRTLALCPALDARAPKAPDVDRVVPLAAGWPGGVYVHCAAGHGRSALIAALIVVERGLAPDLDAAEARLRAVRPEVRLHGPQRRFGQRWLAARGPR